MKNKNPGIIRLESSQERLIKGGSASNWIEGLVDTAKIAFQLLSIFKLAFSNKGSMTNKIGKFSWDNSTRASDRATNRLQRRLGITRQMVDDYKQFRDVYSD